MAALVAPLVDEASRRGLARDTLLRTLGVDAAGLRSTEKRIDLPLLLAAWEAAMRFLQDPALPIAVGKLASVERFDILGHAISTRPTFREGVETLLRFHDVLNDTGRFWMEPGPRGFTRVHWTRSGARTLGMRVANEQVVSSAVTFTRAILGEHVGISRIRFQHPKPRKVHAHEEHFRAPIEWDATGDSLDVESAYLDRPPLGADPTIASLFGHQAVSALARVSGSGTWVQRFARGVASALPTGIPTLADVADQLGTSERTARRRLAEENETFDGIVVRVQRARADELLGSEMPLRDVALAVGFADASAFSRAYRRWTGKPPSASRRQARDS
jgi:AraC-like DNA-binding protein